MNVYIHFPKGDCKYVFPSNKTQWCQLFDYKEMFSNADENSKSFVSIF